MQVEASKEPFRKDIKIKNDGCSVGTLHGGPIERLAFLYDRHEEITRHIWMKHIKICYHPTVIHVFCLPLKYGCG